MNNYFLVKLKEVRIEKKLTQKQLAQLSGCSAYKIRKWEKCISFPSIFEAIKLSDKLNVRLNYLRGICSTKEIYNYDDILNNKNFSCLIFD